MLLDPTLVHAIEHSFIKTDLARAEPQWLQHQTRNIRPSKKEMWQFSNAQLYGVMTGSQILERDDKDHAVKAKKTNFNRLSAPNPIKTQNTIKTPSTADSPAIQPSRALSTHSY